MASRGPPPPRGLPQTALACPPFHIALRQGPTPAELRHCLALTELTLLLQRNRTKTAGAYALGALKGLPAQWGLTPVKSER